MGVPTMSRPDVLVVGGGPAGMMAAIAAAENGAACMLLEPNSRLGKKLNITGKGRCNLTNNCDAQELMRHVPQNGRFLYSAFSKYDSQDVMAFFEALGVPLKTERGNRVFPASDRSFDISGALERHLRDLQVPWVRDRAAALLLRDSRVSGIRGERGVYEASSVVIATGGVSYPLTGSTGDGYRLAKSVGHTVVPPKPSLIPLVERGHFCAEMQGLSLRNVTLTAFEEEKKVYQDFGELLFTHFGLSGPLVLSASAHMRHLGERRYRVEIDLKPALDEQMLDRRMLSDFEKHINNDFLNALGDLLPRKMIPTVVARSGIPPHSKVHSITREQRCTLARLIKHFSIDLAGARPVEEAIITSGGVTVGEVNPSTMASRLVPGLYFAGEVLDVDAYTGGFNLQIAWSTGHLAGESAARWAGEQQE